MNELFININIKKKHIYSIESPHRKPMCIESFVHPREAERELSNKVPKFMDTIGNWLLNRTKVQRSKVVIIELYLLTIQMKPTTGEFIFKRNTIYF